MDNHSCPTANPNTAFRLRNQKLPVVAENPICVRGRAKDPRPKSWLGNPDSVTEASSQSTGQQIVDYERAGTNRKLTKSVVPEAMQMEGRRGCTSAELSLFPH